MPYANLEKRKEYHRNYMREYNKVDKPTPEQKARKAGYMKDYVLRNFSKLAAYQRERQIKDKERIRLRRKEYVRKNKETISEKRRQDYIKNKDNVIHKSKEYYMKNKDKIKEVKNRYRISPKGRLLTYKQSAKKRGYDFLLNPEDFTKLLGSKCHFCGVTKANGIDRIDSKKGYIYGNVLPCCKICNFMKGVNSYSFFIKHIKKISKNC